MAEGGRLTDSEVIGLAVRQVRMRANLGREEVESRAELAEGSLASIESGEASPRWGALRRIVYAIGISLPELMEEVEEIEAQAED
jgi:transcriptional regulator with XRE-family HTH domain